MNDHWLITHDLLMLKWGLVSFLFSTMAALGCASSRINPNIWHIPRNIFRFFLFIKRGRRYVARIDGVWRIIKGGHIHSSGFLHTAKLFPDDKSHCLIKGEFLKVNKDLSEEELQDWVISLNLRDLQMGHPHPRKEKFYPRGKPQDPFAAPEPPWHDDEYFSRRYRALLGMADENFPDE